MKLELFKQQQLSKKALKEINAGAAPDCRDGYVWEDKMEECVPIEGNSSGQACETP